MHVVIYPRPPLFNLSANNIRQYSSRANQERYHPMWGESLQRPHFVQFPEEPTESWLFSPKNYLLEYSRFRVRNVSGIPIGKAVI